ncbi:UDP-glycosyltransferase 90A1-like protein [Carex littledalei]|uniref:UDP-glycosyltransferase 90A1-like protein n=1 Tax=Carex littledalei TaxID=544730 RepID=A0A833VLJ8_9POAL|nr:UDP-glycosyltransferase 90A1-like protein [Carex littledalei]
MDSSSSHLSHIAIFPFMSKGHTIPLLHLAHLLHHRRLVSHITFFTTPLNAPFIRSSLSLTAAQNTSIVALPFPDNLPHDIPPGTESTDQLPSFDLFLPFVTIIPRLRPAFFQAISRFSPRPSLLISDGFLGWTQYVATELSIPSFVSYGMGGFANTVSALVSIHKPHAKVSSPDEPFAVPGFPHLSLTKADLEPPFDDPDPKGPHWDFVVEQTEATKGSRGFVMNSFYELEQPYFDYMDSKMGGNNYRVGPLCLARLGTDKKNQSQSPLLDWLDSRLSMNRPVLYVAFGTQIKLSLIQMKELATGLEWSGLDFIWVMRGEKSNWCDGFAERIGDRRRYWRIKPVHGFISHCGWNSVMETLCAGVPVLAWPMIAEQRLNAKFVVEELKMGLRIRASDGTKDGLVEAAQIERLTIELLVGEEGKAAKKKAEELAMAARQAMDEGGSSYVALEKMIRDVCVDLAS